MANPKFALLRSTAERKSPTVKVHTSKGRREETCPTIEADFLLTWKLRRDPRFAEVLREIEALSDQDRFQFFELILTWGTAGSLENPGRPAGAKRKPGDWERSLEQYAQETVQLIQERGYTKSAALQFKRDQLLKLKFSYAPADDRKRRLLAKRVKELLSN